MRLGYFGAAALAMGLAVGCGGDDDGPVSGTDAGPGGIDSGPVTTTDSGPTTGTDAGPTTGTDAGPTTGTDAGPTTGGGQTGDACGGDGECMGTMAMCLMSVGGFLNFPGGYCSASCAEDADCGAGASCAGFPGVFSGCLRDCTADSDCRMDEGYTCRSLGFGGGGETYCLPPMGGGTFP